MIASEHVALVTGGGRGIGAAVARRIGREGATVLVAARSKDQCAEVAEAIRAEGGQAWPLELDVSDPDSVARAVEEARMVSSAIGPVDWLVNNAGFAEVHRVLKPREDPQTVYDRLMDVNFHGARRLVEALAPDMALRGYGRIVNLASSAGLVGYANLTPYCASKFALVGYSFALAKELREKGIGVVSVCPHYVDSPMIDGFVQAYAAKGEHDEAYWRDWFRAQNPGGDLVSMEEVAGAVWESLAGEATGIVLELDGARTITLSDERSSA